MTKSNLAGLALAALILSAGTALAAPPALYTAAQASDGATVFAQNCAMCHGAALQGAAAPALVGTAFDGPALHETVGQVFSIVADQMPAGNPGGLTQDQYAAVFAYILSKNGYPAGSAALDYTASLTSAVPLVSPAP